MIKRKYPVCFSRFFSLTLFGLRLARFFLIYSLLFGLLFGQIFRTILFPGFPEIILPILVRLQSILSDLILLCSFLLHSADFLLVFQ